MGPVLAIVGATATGKSALALRLAERLDGELVNADALQVYRGFDIGTAKPSPADRRRVRHHLLDILEPQQRFSAGEFVRLARRAVADILERGRQPVVVGGSGLYLRALFEGIREIPPIDPAVRRALRRRLAGEGPDGLRAELRRVDPETAERLAVGDSQRLLRALEVAVSTGKPLSLWLAEKPFGEVPLAAVRVGLTLPRALLYDRISARIEQMVRDGWVEEVSGLLARGSKLSDPAFQAIGYRQLASYLAGESTLAEAIESTQRATRRFAKRQQTWFRREKGVRWFDPADLDQTLQPVVDLLVYRSARARGGNVQADD